MQTFDNFWISENDIIEGHEDDDPVVKACNNYLWCKDAKSSLDGKSITMTFYGNKETMFLSKSLSEWLDDWFMYFEDLQEEYSEEIQSSDYDAYIEAMLDNISPTRIGIEGSLIGLVERNEDFVDELV